MIDPILPSGLSLSQAQKQAGDNPVSFANPTEGQIFRDPRAGVGLENKVLQRVGNNIMVMDQSQYSGDYNSLPQIPVQGSFENELKRAGGGFINVGPTGQNTPSSIVPATLNTTVPVGNTSAGNVSAPFDYQAELAKITAPVGSPERTTQLLALGQRLLGSNSGQPTPATSSIGASTGNSASATIPSTNSSAPSTAPIVAPVNDISSLYSNTAITALENKIKDQSAKVSAGLASGGASDILKNQFEKFGIAAESSLVNAYNAQILDTQARLRKIPDDIKTTLADIGVSDAQLNRLIVHETQKPLETLRDLMEAKGVAQDHINTSLKFVSMFADAEMKDQAAKIEAMKYDVETNKDLLKTLDDKQMKFLELAIQNRKDSLSTLNDLAKGGAPTEVLAAARNMSQGEMIQKYGQYLSTPQLKGGATEGFSQYDPTTGTWKQVIAPAPTIAGGGTYVPGSNPSIDNWAKLIISGQAKLTDVPNPKGSTARTDVANAIQNSGQLLLSDKDREKLAVIQNAQNVVSALEDLSNGISPSNAFTRFFVGPLNYLSAYTQYNDKNAAFQAARNGFVSSIARTLGEKGALSEGDITRAVANLPTLADTVAVRNDKLNTLKTIFEKNKEAIINTSTQTLSDLNKGATTDEEAQLRAMGYSQAQIDQIKMAK